MACIRQIANLESEFKEAFKSDPQPQPDSTGQLVGGTDRRAFREVIRRDRQCPGWFPYQPGLTPREHVERLHVLELERDRAALQERLAAMERDSRQSSEKIQADSLEIAKAVETFTTRWTYAAFILAAIGVFLVAAAYLFPDLGVEIGHRIAPWLSAPPVASPVP
jgi:hypothetical protein